MRITAVCLIYQFRLRNTLLDICIGTTSDGYQSIAQSGIEAVREQQMCESMTVQRISVKVFTMI
jgi:hypothetical protein